MSEPFQPGPTGAPKRNWADLGPRLLSAFVLIPITAATLWIGGIQFALVTGLVFAGVYREWETMLLRAPLTLSSWLLVCLMVVLGLAFSLFGLAGGLLVLALMLCIGVGVGGEDRVWRLFGTAFFAFVTMGVIAMRGDQFDGVLAGVFCCATVWMTDSGAFFTGRQIGGEKLAPIISPSKTWSGSIGGLTIGTLTGTILWTLFTDSPLWIGAVFALTISLLSQIGDLSESAIKRHYRIKDSGDIIPGHGGLMDRLDSLTLGVFFLIGVGWAHGGPDAIASGFLRW